MTYDEAYQKIVQVISEIQQQTSPDILYSVVTQSHKQVEELYGWILIQRFEKEKQETEKGAANTEVVQ
jgi:hypothetical protein